MAKKRRNSPKGIRTLRSINIPLDIRHPDRLEGYVPTAKSVELTKTVFKGLNGSIPDRSFAIAAPYGSGKSSAGLLWCSLAEQSLKKALPKLHADMSKRLRSEGLPSLKSGTKKMLAIPLQGFEKGVSADVIKGVAEALKRHNSTSLARKIASLPKDIDGVLQTLELLQKEVAKKFGGAIFVWDEFGKTLEHCAAKGDSKGLFEVQTLSEACQRSNKKFPITLCLLLHQSFSQYASNLPGYVKTEWSKIEGRFKQIDYIEDSKEIYTLIGEVVGGKAISTSDAARFANQSHKIGLFKEFSQTALKELLSKAAPLTPPALFVLPQVSGRVGQNERTLFTFLCSEYVTNNKTAPLTPASLFDYFADLMRTDTGMGGSHKIWSQVQSALGKCKTDDEQEVTKILGILSLSKDQTKLHTTPELVALAQGLTSSEDIKKTEAVLKGLLSAKTVFYNRLHDEYTVWQATDTDVRSAVSERKAKYEIASNVKEFLDTHYAPPARYPQRYNDQRAMRRYFDGVYVLPNEVELISDFPSGEIRDGRIYYVLAETKKDIAETKRIAATIRDPKKVVAIPKTPLGIRSSVAEVQAYHELLTDPDYAGEGSAVAKELKQLADESERFLGHQLRQLVQPGVEGPQYFYKGKTQNVADLGGLKRFLSKAVSTVFPESPYFNNEMINKAEPSPSIVNARKKILRAIINTYGEENMALEGYGPDVSIFRALLLKPGIYRKGRNAWAFAAPKQVEDERTSHFWALFIDFWTKPAKNPKDLSKFIAKLTAPPLGVREGLIPLFLGASFRTATNVINVLEDDLYVPELRAETFERMLKSPAAFTIEVPALSPKIKTYLAGIQKNFGSKGTTDEDPIRAAVSAIMSWAKGLPQAALEPKMISKDVDAFVLLLRSAKDPSRFLLTDLVHRHDGDHQKTLAWLKKLKRAMDGLEDALIERCAKALTKGIGAANVGNVQSTLVQWRNTLPGDLEAYRGDPLMTGFLTRVSQSYESEVDFTKSLAELFAHKPLRFWQHSHISQFELNLTRTIRNIESLAETLDLEQADLKSDKPVQVPWTEKKIKRELTAIQKKLGAEKTRDFLDRILKGLSDSDDAEQ